MKWLDECIYCNSRSFEIQNRELFCKISKDRESLRGRHKISLYVKWPEKNWRNIFFFCSQLHAKNVSEFANVLWPYKCISLNVTYKEEYHFPKLGFLIFWEFVSKSVFGELSNFCWAKRQFLNFRLFQKWHFSVSD